MKNYIGQTSLAVSASISRFIMNRAKAAYLQRIKTEVLYNKSLEVSKDFPIQCTQQLFHLYHYPSSPGASRLIGESQTRPPQSSRDHQRLVRTVRSSPRHSYIKPVVNTGQSTQPASATPKDSVKSIGGAKKFVLLAQKSDQTRQIEVMREKKIKRAQLQISFLQAEKLERSKARLRPNDLISSLFTTDFNGDRLQIHPSSKRIRKDESKMQLDLKINEEREVNLSVMEKQSDRGKQPSSKMIKKKKYMMLKDIDSLVEREGRRRQANKDYRLAEIR